MDIVADTFSCTTGFVTKGHARGSVVVANRIAVSPDKLDVFRPSITPARGPFERYEAVLVLQPVQLEAGGKSVVASTLNYTHYALGHDPHFRRRLRLLESRVSQALGVFRRERHTGGCGRLGRFEVPNRRDQG